LRNFISKIFIKKVSPQPESDKKIKIGKDYEINDGKRIESLNVFLKFAEEFNLYQKLKLQIENIPNLRIQENLEFINEFMRKIKGIKEHLRSKQVLPLNELFS
jgi:hypothetical protein